MDKGLLVVSFGTSYVETRERTIDAIERKLEERFPDRAVRRAWTSSFLIRKVAKAEGLIVDTPEEALEKLASEGVTDVIVQPTHLSDGYENQRMTEPDKGQNNAMSHDNCTSDEEGGKKNVS